MANVIITFGIKIKMHNTKPAAKKDCTTAKRKPLNQLQLRCSSLPLGISLWALLASDEVLDVVPIGLAVPLSVFRNRYLLMRNRVSHAYRNLITLHMLVEENATKLTDYKQSI